MVPMPPGRTTTASDRANIAALRSCRVAVTIMLAQPGLGDFGGDEGFGNDADDTAAADERGAGGQPHQSVAPPP